MKNTRQRILEYLHNHRTVTAEELSHALHMTSANIRYHLAKLLQRGSIEIVGERPPIGRGRPANVYSLPHQTIGENLDILASTLLIEALESKEGNPEEILAFLKRIARQLAGKYKTPGSLSQRLFQTVRRLNHLNYRARWEARAQAPALILEHCPYLRIIEDHPELCIMDASMLEHLLGVPAEQTTKLARDLEGGTYCMFKIHP